jgi:hypothetical protein
MMVEFLATFQSDSATGISPPPENFPSGMTNNLLENGALQLLTPAGFLATLPALGLVPLAVSAQSDVQAVPGPVVGAGLLGLIAACGALLMLARRRRKTGLL